MKNFNIKMIVLAISLTFSAGAMAQSMSKNEYKASKAKIVADYKVTKNNCSGLSGNPRDICVSEAKGLEDIAKAELDAAYKPSRKNSYKVSVAKADATYSVAKERCDDATGNAKDVCVKEAKVVNTSALGAAKVQLKSADASAAVTKKNFEAADKTSTARKDASADNVDARYAVAVEKCDTFSGAAKDGCLSQAKTRFGK